MKNEELIEALRQIEREKGIKAETLIEALETALVSAYQRNYGVDHPARVEMDRESGEIRVFRQELDEEENVVSEEEVTPDNFGRIAAQTAKQVILQRIKEAERELVYDEYHERVGDIVTGIVQQSDSRATLVDLGKVEAVLPHSEQMPGERYEHGARVKVFIVEVRRTSKGPQILVSRTHPGLVKRLFELEVPEIEDGYVEIRAVAREPGHRSKIAVFSRERNVDPVGACVGSKGSRVRMVVNELRGEKVDIVPWSDDPKTFVINSLSPARIKDVIIDPDEGSALVIVPDNQLSLAIGKEGQNARLAARLTSLRIDIKSESQLARERAGESREEADGGSYEAPAPEEEGAGGEEAPLAEQGTEGPSEELAGEAPEPGDVPGEAEGGPPDDGEEEAEERAGE
jgi:N utilization substance protein A